MLTSWESFIALEQQKEYFKELNEFVAQRREQTAVFPPKEHIFRAFELTPLQDVKVVILGQDPYHQEGQANGLSFSVNKRVKLPPSLRNMFVELASDMGCIVSQHGDLTYWAKQGVLLLNTVLTVEEGKANAHKNKGWEQFTDAAIRLLNEQERPIVFVLWGTHAQKKKIFITGKHHHVLTGVHPSPLSSYRGFFGSKPYSQINRFLVQTKQMPIDWCLPE